MEKPFTEISIFDIRKKKNITCKNKMGHIPS